MKRKRATSKRPGKAVVLFSGGLDSTTVLYHVLAKGYEPTCLLFDYGQRHRKELTCAEKTAKRLGVPMEKVKTALPWRGSALLDKEAKLPKGRAHRASIPATYVPGRNIIFLSYAVSLAEAIGARHVFIGANQIDYSGYPDCRGEFLKAFEEAALQGTRAGARRKGIRIHAPLLDMTKADIVRLALKLGVPIDDTWSCYRGGRTPCGVCDSCVLREQGMRAAKEKA